MAGDGLGAGPEGATPDELVLRDICENNVEERPSNEDADHALAKVLQDQERAMMHLTAFRGENGWQDQNSEDGEESGDDGSWEEEVGAAEEAARGEGNAGDEELDDEALAQQLQEEEAREHYRRLLEMLGGEEGGEEDDEDEEGYMTEDSLDDMTYEELQALGDAVGTVSRGVHQDVIDALPNAKYTSRFSDAHPPNVGEEEEQCAVCRMEFEAGEDVRQLPCKHVYHPDCIGQWLHINKVCPICNHDVTKPESNAAEAAAEVETGKSVLEPRNK